MSRTPNTQTSRQPRIVLVGRAASLCAADGFGTAARQPRIVCAENLFAAIGEISTAPSHEPVGLVLLTADQLESASDRTLAGIRRLDPGVRIVLVRDRRQPHVPIDAEAFDARIDAPVDAPRLLQLLNGAAARDDDGDDSSQPHAGQSPDVTASADEQPSDRSPQAAEKLGDTDLVDGLLNRPDGIQQLALDLIQQQTGWNDLELVQQPDAAQPGDDVPVEHGGKSFGVLRCPGASNDELTQWAGWLGQWLALDAAHRRYRYLAFHDELTGAWNRRYFMSFLADCIERAGPRRRPITVMVFDIDDFKLYNDSYGHSAGDEILRESVRLLTSVIRQGDRVCRIGGDEFAVIFADIEGPREPGSQHPESIEQIAHRYQNEICRMHFPKLGIEAPGSLSISGGLATYPWDGRTPEDLLEHADTLALESKRKGKNVITFGPGAQEKCRLDDDALDDDDSSRIRGNDA